MSSEMQYERVLLNEVDLQQAFRRLISIQEPEKCDMCGISLAEETLLVDGALKPGPGWAFMCPACYATKGKGIGCGLGQVYMRQLGGRWLLVAGFCPEPSYEEE